MTLPQLNIHAGSRMTLRRRRDSKLSSALKAVFFRLRPAKNWALRVLGERQMKVYPPIVEQLSQLFLNNWDNCSTLVNSLLPLALARLAWRRRLSSVCRLVSPKENPGLAISAVVHATILIVLALLIVPTSPGKAIQWLLLSVQERDQNDELGILEEITVQISLSEPTDDAHHPLLGEGDLPKESVSTKIEPVQLADLSLPVPGMNEFDFPSSDSLLRGLDESRARICRRYF